MGEGVAYGVRGRGLKWGWEGHRGLWRCGRRFRRCLVGGRVSARVEFGESVKAQGRRRLVRKCLVRAQLVAVWIQGKRTGRFGYTCDLIGKDGVEHFPLLFLLFKAHASMLVV